MAIIADDRRVELSQDLALCCTGTWRLQLAIYLEHIADVTLSVIFKLTGTGT